MAKVVILGVGFAGREAARLLARAGLEVTVVDPRPDFELLPSLPDIVGRGVRPDTLRAPTAAFCRAHGIRLIPQAAEEIDTARRTVRTAAGGEPYDYLLVACGSETDFRGRDELRPAVRRLDGVAGAAALKADVEAGRFDAFVVAGGGYTGIEAATAIRRLSDRCGRRVRVVIVEPAGSVLAGLPEWMRLYVERNLASMGIETACGTQLGAVEGGRVTLASGAVLESARAVWAAGVRIPAFTQGIPCERDRQGRMKADAFLRIADRVFAAGDACRFETGGRPLRMGVQFAIMEARCAAANIRRAAAGRPLAAYRPVDLGFIVPMANGRACGKVLGLRVTGCAGTALHFFMCAYRAGSVGQGLRLWRDVLGGG